MPKAVLQELQLLDFVDRMTDIEKRLDRIEDWLDDLDQTLVQLRRAIASRDNGTDFDSYSPPVDDDE